jgi:AraC-like DNA-binding protein
MMDSELNTIICWLMIFILTLFTILLLHIGRHTKSNIYLAIYFISQIIGILSVFIYPSNKLVFIIYYICQSVCYAWGGLFYLFISSLFEPRFKFKFKTVLHFIPAILVFIILIFYFKRISIKYFDQPLNWLYNNLSPALSYFFNLLIIGYNIAIIYKYYRYFLKGKSANSKITSTIWVKISVFGFTISCFIVQIHRMHLLPSLNTFLLGNAAFLVYFCVLLYVAIINRTLTDKIEIAEKYKNSSLSSGISNEIMERIQKCMEEDKTYIDPELSLRNLAAILNIQEKYISEVINKLKRQNFSDYVNSYRISYAKSLLKNPENKDKTMLYVLFESGFNSKTTFNNSFKKIVGCTPLEYKKSCLDNS